MEKFNRGGRSGGGSNRKFGGRSGRSERSGGNRGFDNKKSGRSSMTKATCSECGNACEVPFKPTGDKPVFCSSCFRNKGENSNQNRFSGRDSGRSKFGEKRMYSAICSGCGNKCEVPFQPMNSKPVYCSNCFEKNDSTGNKNTEQFQKQFEILNVKLDEILKSLSPEVSKKVVDIKKTTKKTETAKAKKPARKVLKSKSS